MNAPFIKYVATQHRPKLAEELGISTGHLGDLLVGRRLPSLPLATRIERKSGGAVPVVSWVDDFAACVKCQSPSRDTAKGAAA